MARKGYIIIVQFSDASVCYGPYMGQELVNAGGLTKVVENVKLHFTRDGDKTFRQTFIVPINRPEPDAVDPFLQPQEKA